MRACCVLPLPPGQPPELGCRASGAVDSQGVMYTQVMDAAWKAVSSDQHPACGCKHCSQASVVARYTCAPLTYFAAGSRVPAARHKFVGLLVDGRLLATQS